MAIVPYLLYNELHQNQHSKKDDILLAAEPKKIYEKKGFWAAIAFDLASVTILAIGILGALNLIGMPLAAAYAMIAIGSVIPAIIIGVTLVTAIVLGVVLCGVMMASLQRAMH